MSFFSYNDLSRSLPDEQHGFMFAIDRGLIKRTGTCECGGVLNLRQKTNQKWGFVFQCTKSRSICGKSYSMLHGTWFGRSHLPIHDQILLIYCFCIEVKSHQLEKMFGISCHVAADWQSYFRDIAAIYMSEVVIEKIGGIGQVVEIDETKIFRRKNHQGRLAVGEEKSEWVFGGICRETKQTFFRIVPDRSEDTLVQVLLTNVYTGTTIMSDCWRGYQNLTKYGFRHATVNHSENFLNPDDESVHTQTIERAWRGLKENIPKSSRYDVRLSYLMVYSFKRHIDWYGMSANSRFDMVLNLIARFY
jgi:hypothetical protein